MGSALATTSAVVAIVAIVVTSGAGGARVHAQDAPQTLVLFERPGCPHCQHAERWLVGLARRRSGIRVERRDVTASPEVLGELRALAAEQRIAPVAVPAVLVRGRLFVGWGGADTTGRSIEAWLDGDGPGVVGGGAACAAEQDVACEELEATVQVPLLGDVSPRELGLPLFTVVLGLIDGFNPCAMWVLLFLLSMLVHLQDRRRMALIAGTFVLVSALVYFAFMAAWLEAYLLLGLSRTVQIVLGVFALGVAAIHAKDFLSPGRGPSLSIPAAAKPHIYARVRAIVRAENLPGALAMVVMLAVMVNLVELLCTAGLPALYTQVLATHDLGRAGRYAYLALYDLAYMADDAVMVGIGVVTLGRTKLQERGGRALKLVSGLVIGALGLVLLVRPEWLMWG